MVYYERTRSSKIKNTLQTLSFVTAQLLNKPEYYSSKKIISVSNAVKKDLVTLLGIPAKKIDVIYNGVDAVRFKPTTSGLEIRKALGAGNVPVILYVGRLDRRKGMYTVLEAAKEFNEKNMKAFFVIVGSGHQQIVNKRQNFAFNNVIVTGRVSDKLLPSYYAMSDIIVAPSLYEGGPPLTLLEAMASAKPVITTNITPINELVNNECSVLIPPNDVGCLVKSIKNLLDNEQFRQNLGLKARQKVLDSFTWDKTAEQTEEVYKEICGY
jgi:glycosyltransferase involved in cell wall biosynthesis